MHFIGAIELVQGVTRIIQGYMPCIVGEYFIPGTTYGFKSVSSDH